MFHLSTVENSTFQTLAEVFELHEIKKQFALAGGTSLALQIGHRMSVDLEVFSEDTFSTDALSLELNAHFQGDYELLGLTKSMLFTNIKKVKCDFIREPAKTIRPHVFMGGVRMYSVEDICAMKMHTICGKGKKRIFLIFTPCYRIFLGNKCSVGFRKNMATHSSITFGEALSILKMQRRMPTSLAFYLIMQIGSKLKLRLWRNVD